MPGVSIRQAPPGSGSSARWVVVWRPRASLSRTSAVFMRSRPSSVLVSVDLPAPDEPTSTAVVPGASQGASAATLPACLALTGTMATPVLATSASAASASSALATVSSFVSTTTGMLPLPCTNSR